MNRYKYQLDYFMYRMAIPIAPLPRPLRLARSAAIRPKLRGGGPSAVKGQVMGAASGTLGVRMSAVARACQPGAALRPVLPAPAVPGAGAGAVPVPGLLVDPCLLRGHVVVFVAFGDADTAAAEDWVAQLGGQAVCVADLRAATRVLDAGGGGPAAVILHGEVSEGGAGGLAALGRLRVRHPRAAILRAISGLRLNDFGADRPLERDSALRLPFRPAAFRLGMAQALANADRRQADSRG